MPIKFEKDPENIVTLTFDAPGAPVNTMTEAFQKAFTESVARLVKEKASTRGVILASAKKTFFAGAELKDVLKFGPNDGPQVFHWIEAAKKRLHHNVLAIALANKLARIAWSVLARGRAFEVRKMDEAASRSA